MVSQEVGQGSAGASCSTTPDLAGQQCAPRDRLLLDLVHKQPLLIALNLLLACLLVAALQDVVATFKLLGWLGVMIAAQVVRFGVWWHLRPVETTLSSGSIGRRLTIASLLAGIGWGLAGLLLVVPGPTLPIMVASCVIGSVAACAITVLPNHPIAYYAFSLPALLPYAARLGFAGDPTAQLMGLLVFVCLGGISFVGHEVNRSLRRAISRLSRQCRGHRRSRGAAASAPAGGGTQLGGACDHHGDRAGVFVDRSRSRGTAHHRQPLRCRTAAARS